MPTPLRTPQTSGHSSSCILDLPLWSLRSPPSHGSKIIIFYLSQSKCTLLHTFCTPAGKPCFSLHCLHSVHREQSLSGRGPSISPAARPFCRLKAPLGLSLLRCARKREFSILFSGKQQAGELTPLLGVHLPDNFQHPFGGDLDAVRQIFFYRRRAGFWGTDVL